MPFRASQRSQTMLQTKNMKNALSGSTLFPFFLFFVAFPGVVGCFSNLIIPFRTGTVLAHLSN